MNNFQKIFKGIIFLVNTYKAIIYKIKKPE